MLSTALAAQYGFGLVPCDLCIYQRWPYAAVAGLAGWALLSRRLRRALLWLSVLVLLAGSAIAAYHAGVEQGIFEGPDGCAGDNIDGSESIEELRRKILAARAVRCDEPAIELWGFFTMAGANMAASFLLAAWAACALVFYPRTAKGKTA